MSAALQQMLLGTASRKPPTAWSWTAISSFYVSSNCYDVSDDGQKIILNVGDRYLWVSVDGGLNWTQCQPQLHSYLSNEWHYNQGTIYGVTISGDGSRIAVAWGDVWTQPNYTTGYIMGVDISTDNGAHWTQATLLGTTHWSIADIDISQDGQVIVVVRSGHYWVSTDYGAIFMHHIGPNYLANVWLASDGVVGLVRENSGYTLSKSSDTFNTLSLVNTGFSYGVLGAALSGDGQKIFVTDAYSSSNIARLSLDGGISFANVTLPHSVLWGCSISRDGQVLFVSGSSGLYWSINNGVTWTLTGSSYYFDDAIPIRLSADGRKAVTRDYSSESLLIGTATN